MGYKNKLDRFDMERGDVLLIPRETCIELRELQEDAAKVLLPFVSYVAGEPGDPLPEVNEDDPRMKRVYTGMLLRMIEHQRQSAAKYADRLATQRENALKRWHKGDGEPCDGIPPHTMALNKDKEEDKDQVSKRELDTLSIPNKLGTATPFAGGVGVNAAPGEVATVYGDEPDGGLNVKVSHAELESDPVGAMMEFLRPTDGERMKVLNTLKARMKQAGRDTFVAVCWRFLKEAETKTLPWFNAACKIEEFCEDANIDHEEFQRTHRKEAAKYELLEKAALDFNPELGEPARILFGMLKAYKTEPTPR